MRRVWAVTRKMILLISPKGFYIIQITSARSVINRSINTKTLFRTEAVPTFITLFLVKPSTLSKYLMDCLGEKIDINRRTKFSAVNISIWLTNVNYGTNLDKIYMAPITITTIKLYLFASYLFRASKYIKCYCNKILGSQKTFRNTETFIASISTNLSLAV